MPECSDPDKYNNVTFSNLTPARYFLFQKGGGALEEAGSDKVALHYKLTSKLKKFLLSLKLLLSDCFIVS